MSDIHTINNNRGGKSKTITATTKRTKNKGRWVVGGEKRLRRSV